MPRQALSLETHLLQGTASKTVPLPPVEQVQGRPEIPKHLKGAQRSTFKKFAKLLADRGTCTPGDWILLAEAAVIYCRWKTALADVESRGAIIESTVLDKHGAPVTREKKNIQLQIAQESEKSLVGILDRLGLTPEAREKIRPALLENKSAHKPGTVLHLIEQAARDEEARAN